MIGARAVARSTPLDANEDATQQDERAATERSQGSRAKIMFAIFASVSTDRDLLAAAS